MKKRLLPAAGILIALLLLFVCNFKSERVEIRDKLIATGPGVVFSFSDVAPYTWDTLYVLPPHKYDILKKENLSIPFITRMLIRNKNQQDDIVTLLFTADKRLLEYACIPRSALTFDSIVATANNSSAICRLFPRDEFRIWNKALRHYRAYTHEQMSDFSEKVQAYQKGVHIDWSKNILDPATFQIDDYMKMFNKLSLKPGEEYYFYYVDYGFGSYPQIAVKSKDYHIDDSDLKKLYSFLDDNTTKACNNLIPEDSEEGYFQYLFFQVFGERFALGWHSNYGEMYLICTPNQIEDIIKKYSTTRRFSCDKAELENLRTIDPCPIIRMDEEYCRITWYEIHTHGGIYKKTYRIDRFKRHLVHTENEEELVDIKLNFIY